MASLLPAEFLFGLGLRVTPNCAQSLLLTSSAFRNHSWIGWGLNLVQVHARQAPSPQYCLSSSISRAFECTYDSIYLQVISLLVSEFQQFKQNVENMGPE